MIRQMHTLTVDTFALGRTGSGTKLAKGSLRAGRAQQSTCESMHLAVTFSAWKDVLYDYIC